MIKHRTRTSRIPFFFDIHDGRLFRPVLKIRRSQMPNAMRATAPTAVVMVSIVQIQQMIYAFVIKIHHVACPRIVSARRIEVNRFLRNELNDRGVTITKQAISEKRQFIDPIVYIDMNDSFISKIYAHQEEMALFKGFYTCAIDSSTIEIPNTKLTRKEFNIPKKTQLHKDTSGARISCMVDTHWDFVISSNLTNKSVNEVTHAIFHLNDVKDKIDLTKTITIYDRGYNYTELMVKTIQLNSYFLMRSKKSTFKNKQIQPLII